MWALVGQPKERLCLKLSPICVSQTVANLCEGSFRLSIFTDGGFCSFRCLYWRNDRRAGPTKFSRQTDPKRLQGRPVRGACGSPRWEDGSPQPNSLASADAAVMRTASSVRTIAATTRRGGPIAAHQSLRGFPLTRGGFLLLQLGQAKLGLLCFSQCACLFSALFLLRKSSDAVLCSGKPAALGRHAPTSRLCLLISVADFQRVLDGFEGEQCDDAMSVRSRLGVLCNLLVGV